MRQLSSETGGVAGLPLGFGMSAPGRMQAAPPPGQRAQLGLSSQPLLPRGLIYGEHLQEPVMGKGEMPSDNPNTQKFLAASGSSTSLPSVGGSRARQEVGCGLRAPAPGLPVWTVMQFEAPLWVRVI